MTAIYVTHIQIALQDRVPHSTQQLTKCIANLYSEKPKTAGSEYMNYKPDLILSQTDSATYTLRRSYGKAARLTATVVDNKK